MNIAEFTDLARRLLRRHRTNLAPIVKDLDRVLVAQREIREHLLNEFLRAIAASAPRTRSTSVRGHAVRQHRRRTTSERAAAIAARLTAADAIFDARKIGDRSIGDLHWGELGGLVATHASDAASHLRQGTDATADAILLKKIFNHARVDDHTRRVREVVSAKDLRRLDREATREAPRLIEEAMHEYTQRLTRYSRPEELPHAQA